MKSNFNYIIAVTYHDGDEITFVYDYSIGKFVFENEYQRMYGEELSMEIIKDEIERLFIENETYEVIEQYYDEESEMILEGVILYNEGSK